MARKLGPRDNFRIVVEPREMTDFGSIRTSRGLIYGHSDADHERWADDMSRRCDEIVADIKRHADNIGHARVECDQEPICEHCGSRWSEASPDYNGGCCAADQAGYEAEAA